MLPRRPKPQDLPGVEGEGVAPKKDKQLDKMGDDFIDKRDAKAVLATEITALETKMQDRMAVLGIKEYRFGDQIMYLKPGKTHVKVKTVKVEGSENGENLGAD